MEQWRNFADTNLTSMTNVLCFSNTYIVTQTKILLFCHYTPDYAIPQPARGVPQKLYLDWFCKIPYFIISSMPVHCCDSDMRSCSFHGMPLNHPL